MPNYLTHKAFKSNRESADPSNPKKHYKCNNRYYTANLLLSEGGDVMNRKKALINGGIPKYNVSFRCS